MPGTFPDSPKENTAVMGDDISATPKVISPSALAHVVFRTSNYTKMVSFWKTFLGAEITHMNETLCFLRYDDEHHRIAIINMQDIAAKVPASNGLDHVAFSFNSLNDLVMAYSQRKSHGITPTWCVNHGPTTSIYYKDPDGNTIETQVDNFDNVEDANDFMTGGYFAENPIGTDFDPSELVEKLRSGVDEKTIKTRVEIGPRGLPENF